MQGRWPRTSDIRINITEDSDGSELFYIENPEIVKVLIAHGADVNVEGNGGETPLFRVPSAELAGTVQ